MKINMIRMCHIKASNVFSVFLLLSLCLNCIICGNNVVQLTDSNFHTYTSQYELVFINFYADWCRFSQMLAPIFEESYQKILKEIPESNRILFAKVDCDVETTLASRFHISKYPTLKMVVNGKIMKREYRGQRSVEAMTDHIKQQLKDPIEKIDSMEVYDGIDEKKSAIIGYFDLPPGSSLDYSVFRRVATDLKDDCKFYWVTGNGLHSNPHTGRQNFFASKPARTRPGEKDEIYSGISTDYNTLTQWSASKCISLVREITFENAEELTEEGLPFLILFHHPDDTASVELYTKTVQNELQQETSSVNFLIADGIKFAHPLHHLGKEKKDLPLIAIDSFRHMYLFPEFDHIKIPGKLREFILDLHSGKLHREFHFGPDPTTKHVEDAFGNKVTSPPESTFKKLAPSRSRYTLLRDEL